MLCRLALTGAEGQGEIVLAKADGKVKKENALNLVTHRPQGALAPGTLPMEFVSLDQLAPLAMTAVEQLAMEGLQVQSGVSNEDAPAMVDPIPFFSKQMPKTTVPEKSAPKKSQVEIIGEDDEEEEEIIEISGGHRETNPAGVSDSAGGGDWFADLGDPDFEDFTMSLEEWEALDAAMNSEQPALEAGVKGSLPLALPSSGEERESEGGEKGGEMIVAGGGAQQVVKGGKASVVETKAGKMGNTVTIAIMVQLRDPHRNYEPVGAPMMALIQAERVFVAPPVKLGRPMLIKYKSDGDEVENEAQGQELMLLNEGKPQFRITGVHMMGVKSESAGGAKGWGNQKQKQSGSRWLMASGMGKASKNPLNKPQGRSKVKSKEDTIWSLTKGVSSEKSSKALPSSSTSSSSGAGPSGGGQKKGTVIRNADVLLSKTKAKK